MKVIGHRGYPARSLENSRASLQAALDLGVDAIEVDVRLTLDNHLVLSHDDTMEVMAGNSKKISRMTLEELKAIPMRDGSLILTLDEALEMCPDTLLIIELKSNRSVRPLLRTLDRHPAQDVRVASFKLNEVALLQQLRPEIFAYGLERTKPFEALYLAKILRLDGVGFNFWLLNPLTYLIARHRKVDLYAYTINNRVLGWLIHALYPKVWICTDRPDKFIHVRIRREAK